MIISYLPPEKLTGKKLQPEGRAQLGKFKLKFKLPGQIEAANGVCNRQSTSRGRGEGPRGRDTSETIIGMRMMLVELEGESDTRDSLSKFKVSCTAVLPRLPVMALTTKL